MEMDDYRDARNAVIAALGLWAGAVLLGTRADVFARIPVEVFAALAVFASAFSVITVTGDERVRHWLERHDVASAWLALLGIDILVVAAGQALEAGRAGAGTMTPWAPLLLFGVPVTLALAIAAVRNLGGAGAGAAGLSSRVSKAPARRPAAT